MISLGTLLTIVSAQCIVVIVKYSYNAADVSVTDFALSVFLLIYCITGAGFVFVLLGLHLYFTCTNLTTYDYCK